MNSENKEIVNRLCNEIQLFDLCDLKSCSFKKGGFCTDKNLLARFESIKEDDDRPTLVYEDEDQDDDTDLLDSYGGAGGIVEDDDE